MASHVFLSFLTYLVLLYNVLFFGAILNPLPTLIWDVINGLSLREVAVTYPLLTIMFELAICREADSKITVTSLMKNLVAIFLTF